MQKFMHTYIHTLKDKFGKSRKKNSALDPFTDPDWTQDDEDKPPAW
jgi:hypothetical protein